MPVEVIEFGWRTQAAFLESLGARVAARRQPGGAFFKTDQGNLILDCQFGPIADPAALASQLAARAGIVEHGLFIGLAHAVIVGGKNGCYQIPKAN